MRERKGVQMDNRKDQWREADMKGKWAGWVVRRARQVRLETRPSATDTLLYTLRAVSVFERRTVEDNCIPLRGGP